MTTYDNGDDNISPPKKTTSQIEERLMMDDIANEHYMTLSYKIVPKTKEGNVVRPSGFREWLNKRCPC